MEKYKHLLDLVKRLLNEPKDKYWVLVEDITTELNYGLDPLRGCACCEHVSDVFLHNRVKDASPSHIVNDLVKRLALGFNPY